MPKRQRYTLCAVCDKYPIHDPLGVCYKQVTKGGGAYIMQCALGTRYNPHSCACDIRFYGEYLMSVWPILMRFNPNLCDIHFYGEYSVSVWPIPMHFNLNLCDIHFYGEYFVYDQTLCTSTPISVTATSTVSTLCQYDQSLCTSTLMYVTTTFMVNILRMIRPYALKSLVTWHPPLWWVPCTWPIRYTSPPIYPSLWWVPCSVWPTPMSFSPYLCDIQLYGEYLVYNQALCRPSPIYVTSPLWWISCVSLTKPYILQPPSYVTSISM